MYIDLKDALREFVPTISFAVRKMTSTSHVAALSYLVLHKHQASAVTAEVMDRYFFSINTHIFYGLFTSQRNSKFSLSTFFHFPINQIDP